KGGEPAGSDLSGVCRLDLLERRAISAALEKTRGNITEAAKLLGISRRTLHRKLAGDSTVKT
ncbi:MAG: hypothetical protein EBT68_01010, partial [Verrucomicrobia bacterium]|nr:hypothetical protein [Verrucomicrobiota bacterium]